MQTADSIIATSQNAARLAREANDEALRRMESCPGHAAISESDEPFVSCAAVEPYTSCGPAAHGGVTVVETCSCGARRRINVNGRHVENGTWWMPMVDVPAVLTVEQAQARIDADAAREQTQHTASVDSRVLAMLPALRTEEGLRYSPDTTVRIVDATKQAVTVAIRERVTALSWGDLRTAAAQQDVALSALYQAILQVATERLEQEA